jgi:hypothetical protein
MKWHDEATKEKHELAVVECVARPRTDLRTGHRSTRTSP